MPEYRESTMADVRNVGQQVPVVAFYSVQGGVGKSTLARKFAELVTVAPGREGRKPNVLLVDLDVDAQGLTFRIAHDLPQGLQKVKTVHDIIAERNVIAAQAITVTGAVSLASGNPTHRGQLYLMPAAPPEARDLFAVIAGIDKDELLRLIMDMIKTLITQFDIACVVIDCAPGANPYAAAAATIADVPFLIGRNEDATYKQIEVLPSRFQQWYSQFQRAQQKVVINAVAVKDLYEQRAKQYSVFDYIPLTSDVIYETEGLPGTASLRMLLFEKYIVDIISRVFVGMNHLIPEAPDLVGQEWIDIINKLERSEEAPKVKRLRVLRKLRWLGAGLVVIGLALIGVRQLFNDLSATLTNIGIFAAIAGVLVAAGGWYAASERERILTAVNRLIIGGPDEVLRKLDEGASHRRQLEDMKSLARTIPETKGSPDN